MDNECSSDLKLAIINYSSKYKLVPPHQHQQNAVERAIRTMKNHLLSGLATCDPDYPIHEDRLLELCELTLNLLRNLRINPNLSSRAILKSPHDFNKIPLATPGKKILVYIKPTQQKSW